MLKYQAMYMGHNRDWYYNRIYLFKTNLDIKHPYNQ